MFARLCGKGYRSLPLPPWPEALGHFVLPSPTLPTPHKMLLLIHPTKAKDSNFALVEGGFEKMNNVFPFEKEYVSSRL